MNETNDSTKTLTLEVSEAERPVLLAIHQQLALGRKAVPIMRALRDGGPLELTRGDAALLRDVMTGVLDNTGIKGGLLEVADLEERLIGLVGPAAPKAPPPPRKARRAAQAQAKKAAKR
jgi:hypothetical protein